MAPDALEASVCDEQLMGIGGDDCAVRKQFVNKASRLTVSMTRCSGLSSW